MHHDLTQHSTALSANNSFFIDALNYDVNIQTVHIFQDYIIFFSISQYETQRESEPDIQSLYRTEPEAFEYPVQYSIIPGPLVEEPP